MTRLPPIDLEQLDPGIRSTVAWLRSLGFDTVDSGDGSTKFDGADDTCALPVPNVAISVDPDHLAAEADRLASLLLSEHGAQVVESTLELMPDQPVICASYDPANRCALLLLTGWVMK